MLKKIFIFLFISIITLTGCSQKNQLGSNSNSSLPNFTFTSLDRKIIKSSELQNKVVIINFWATSCSSCIAEMPKMIEIFNKYSTKGKGIIMLAVAMPYDVPMYVSNFAKTRNLPFNVGIDSDANITNSFGDINLTPTTFIFANGKRIQKIIGEPNWSEFYSILDTLI